MDSLKDWLKPELIWFIIGLVLLLLEFVVPGLIIFFFGVGAFVVALLCIFLDISVNLQLLLFLVSSIVLLVVLRRELSKTFMGHVGFSQDTSENMDDFTGGRAKVIRVIRPNMPGRVEFHGSQWDAESDEEIPEGAQVEVMGKSNITLKVRTIN
jgi:membrane protein implicated in regulation of membrane protease activity